MFSEKPTQGAEQNFDRSTKAMEAARDLITENPILNNDARVQRIAENDFVTEAGQEVDPGNWIAGMLDKLSALETNTNVVSVTDAEFTELITRNLVTHSDPAERLLTDEEDLSHLQKAA